jgi:hypothetical protein
VTKAQRVRADPAILHGYAASLGQAVEQAWAGHRFHVAAFPEVATRCLSEVEVPAALDATTILRSVAASRHLVAQQDRQSEFGNPPITLWRSRDFFVSALFWLDGTTSIHQHGFAGAFRVLAGGSLHAPYSFAISEEVTHRLVLGDLRLDAPELLRVGDVRSIEPGGRFIHALFHLERPSVTIVVRTYGEPKGEPQFNYLRPGLGYDPFYRDDSLQRRFESVATLADIDPEAGVNAACDLAEGEDLWAGFLLAMHWFNRVERGERFQRLLDALVRRHGSVARLLPHTFDELQRAVSISTRRRMVVDPEHRLFLALLLNLPDRSSVNTILARQFPRSDPGLLLARWVTELAAPERRGISGLVMDERATAVVAKALQSGDTGALGNVGVKVPTMLEDLFRD